MTGPGVKRACLCLRRNSGLVTGGLGEIQGLEAAIQIGLSNTEIGLRVGSVMPRQHARTRLGKSHISQSRESAKHVAKLPAPGPSSPRLVHDHDPRLRSSCDFPQFGFK